MRRGERGLEDGMGVGEGEGRGGEGKFDLRLGSLRWW